MKHVYMYYTRIIYTIFQISRNFVTKFKMKRSYYFYFRLFTNVIVSNIALLFKFKKRCIIILDLAVLITKVQAVVHYNL